MANAPPSKAAIAEALFQEGRDLLAQDKASLACPKFAESQRIDPATGTLLNLATCHQAEGKFATAWSEFNESLMAAQRDGRADRVDFARQHIRDLEARLSRVVIRVTEKTRQDSVRVQLDGVAIGRAGWGVAIPVDPGRHVVVATMEDRPPWKIIVDIEESMPSVDVEVPAWPAPAPPIQVPTPRPRSRTRLAAQLTGAAGALGLATGGLLGWRAYSKWRDADNACPIGRGCSAQAINDRTAAVRAATWADLSVGLGVTALLVSASLWVASSARADAQHARVEWTPELAPGRAGLRVGGTW